MAIDTFVNTIDWGELTRRAMKYLTGIKGKT